MPNFINFFCEIKRFEVKTIKKKNCKIEKLINIAIKKNQNL